MGTGGYLVPTHQKIWVRSQSQMIIYCSQYPKHENRKHKDLHCFLFSYCEYTQVYLDQQINTMKLYWPTSAGGWVPHTWVPTRIYHPQVTCYPLQSLHFAQWEFPMIDSFCWPYLDGKYPCPRSGSCLLVPRASKCHPFNPPAKCRDWSGWQVGNPGGYPS